MLFLGFDDVSGQFGPWARLGPSTLKVGVAWRAQLWLAEAQNLRATTKAMIELRYDYSSPPTSLRYRQGEHD